MTAAPAVTAGQQPGEGMGRARPRLSEGWSSPEASLPALTRRNAAQGELCHLLAHTQGAIRHLASLPACAGCSSPELLLCEDANLHLPCLLTFLLLHLDGGIGEDAGVSLQGVVVGAVVLLVLEGAVLAGLLCEQIGDMITRLRSYQDWEARC